MKEHKHKWIIIPELVPSLLDYAYNVYYICEGCKKFKKVKYTQI